jgi:hypothetical protein
LKGGEGGRRTTAQISVSDATFTTAVGSVKVVSLQRPVCCLNDSSEGRVMDAFPESWGSSTVVSVVCKSSAGGVRGSLDSDTWTSCSFFVVIAISSAGVSSVAIVRI